MDRSRRPLREDEFELSAQGGNPANGLRRAYEKLMAANDPKELYDEATSIVKQYEGKGASAQNVRKFFHTMGQQVRMGPRALIGMKKYISNFILKADGLGVEMVEPWGEIVLDHREAIGSLVTEDVTDHYLVIEPWQRRVVDIASRHGLHIRIL